MKKMLFFLVATFSFALINGDLPKYYTHYFKCKNNSLEPINCNDYCKNKDGWSRKSKINKDGIACVCNNKEEVTVYPYYYLPPSGCVRTGWSGEVYVEDDDSLQRGKFYNSQGIIS